jgi:nucleotide-binding universal stress UspA family protein
LEPEDDHMPDTFEAPPTVVGIDGSPGSEEALQWAVKDARARRRPLRIVTTYTWGLRNRWEWQYDLHPPELKHARRAADVLIGATLEEVRSENPDLSVEGAAIEAPAIEGLLRECAGAATLVLGSRRLGALRATILGSVGNAVAARATCPVVVVRGGSGDHAESAEIVVGIDGSDASDAVIDFAFDFAHDHARPVRAVLGWWPIVGVLPRDERPVTGPATRWLAEILTGWRAKYPDVVVHTEVREAHPVALLVERSREQALIVVGSRGHRATAGTLLGSVSQAVLHHAECPVAVVPH